MTVYYTNLVNVEFESRMKALLIERAATLEQAQPGYWEDIRISAAEYSRSKLGNDYRYILSSVDFK